MNAAVHALEAAHAVELALDADAKAPVGTPTRSRSLAKAFSWRSLASLDTFLLGYLVTGEPLAAGAIAGGEVLTKMALYYFHERAWAAVKWGHLTTAKERANV